MHRLSSLPLALASTLPVLLFAQNGGSSGVSEGGEESEVIVIENADSGADSSEGQDGASEAERSEGDGAPSADAQAQDADAADASADAGEGSSEASENGGAGGSEAAGSGGETPAEDPGDASEAAAENGAGDREKGAEAAARERASAAEEQGGGPEGGPDSPQDVAVVQEGEGDTAAEGDPEASGGEQAEGGEGSSAADPSGSGEAETSVDIPEAQAEEGELKDDDVTLELPGEKQKEAGEGATKGEGQQEKDLISVDFPDAQVRTILRNVADFFDLNVVIPDTLQGRTSVKLHNVTWRQVFEVVLEPLGFTFVEDRNIIRIKSIEEIQTEPVDTRVFVVDYAKAGEIKGSVQPLVDTNAGGRIQVDQRSNALVVTERPSRLTEIQEIIDRLDRATEQVMIESKFVEVTRNDMKNLGVNWTSLSGYRASAGPFERQFSRERSKTETDTASREQTSDQQTTTTTGPGGTTSTTTTTSTNPFESLEEITSTASTSRVDSAVFSAEEFEVILSALNTEDDVKLVSHPTVVTVDNKEAMIHVGETQRFPEFTFNPETGQRQIDGFEEFQFGIQMSVTPQVNSAGFINLTIDSKVEERVGSTVIEGTEFPISAIREAESDVMIKDGFTIAIGGLSEQDKRDGSTKVPLLGDLPGVGQFFRSKSDETTARDLLIFITAKTLNPDGSNYKDIVDPRVMRDMGLVESDVPGYRVPEKDREQLERLRELQQKARRTEEMGEVRQKIETVESRIRKPDAAQTKGGDPAETGGEAEANEKGDENDDARRMRRGVRR